MKLKITILACYLSSFAFAGTANEIYTGTPYPNGAPHAVSGIVEAEDFDNGGEGISWHDQKPGRQNGGGDVYRGNTDVDVQSHNNNTIFAIGNTDSGEWTKYTINATQAGTYKIETYCVSGNNNGTFHLEIDGKPVSRVVNAPNGDWSNYSRATTVENVQLTVGTHVFTWYTYGGMNVDKFVFTRTGEYTGIDDAGNFNYPITKKTQNPMFVEFDSPMYTGNVVGTMYTADPSAHVWEDGRLYVYASHDIEPPQGCDRMDKYHVFSTDDMVNWTDHGQIISAADVSWGLGEGFMFAPDCAYNKEDQTYYFYFPHPTDRNNTGSTWRIGVATSKSPTENFEYKGWVQGLESLIDPSVFVDDDGQPYIIHGGGGKCMIGKLKRDNWLELDGEMKVVEGLRGFHEGPWIHKYNNKYYLSFPDGHGRDGNQLKYAMADSPMGPWTDMGVYMYATGADTNHGSIVEYKGKWYAFYHTANYSGRGSLRSVCFDEIEYNNDGTIKIVQNFGTPYKERTIFEPDNTTDVALTIEAEDFNNGGYHYGYFTRVKENEGNNKTYRPSETLNLSTANGRRYTNMIKGEWARYTFYADRAGLYDISCVLSTNQNNSRFHVSINGTDYSGPRTITSTSWTTEVAKNILLKEGEQYLDIRIEEGSFNFDKFTFTKSEPYTGTVYNKGNHSVPGIIQAEDYDIGGQSVAYFETPWGSDTAEKNSGGAYRTGVNEGVDLQNKNGGIWISHTNGGEWVRYTIDVLEDGIYDIRLRAATGFGSGEVFLIFDFVNEYPLMTINTGGYGNPGFMTTTEGVELTKGKHVMTLNFMNDINLDYIEFYVSELSSKKEVKLPSSIRTYYDRSNSSFVVDAPSEGWLSVRSLNGWEIMRSSLKKNTNRIDVDTLPQGVYVISIVCGQDIKNVKMVNS
jgi:hypothetical protein